MLDTKETQWVCGVLGCALEDIATAEKNPHMGINNQTFIITLRGGEKFLFRRAGEGTQRFADRACEARAYESLRGTPYADEAVGCDPETGRKLTVYYEGARTCRARDAQDRARFVHALRDFHASGIIFERVENTFDRFLDYERIDLALGGALPHRADYAAVRAFLVDNKNAFDVGGKVWCTAHTDCLSANVLFLKDGQTRLIDFEFPAMAHPFVDLADFCHDADLPIRTCMELLALYLGRFAQAWEEALFKKYLACVALMWSAWADSKTVTDPEQKAFYADYRDFSVRFAAAAAQA